jgi:hypothetical protein
MLMKYQWGKFDASETGLDDAFAELQAEVDFNDKFFVFTTNHGGGIPYKRWSQ